MLSKCTIYRLGKLFPRYKCRMMCNPLNTTTPTISFTGGVLTVLPGTWTCSPTFEYRWDIWNEDNSAFIPIPLENETTYTVEESGRYKASVRAVVNGKKTNWVDTNEINVTL